MTPSSDAACCWCLIGAAAKLHGANFSEVYARLRANVVNGNVAYWQDHYATHDMVVALALKLDI